MCLSSVQTQSTVFQPSNFKYVLTSLVAQTVKRLSTMRETWVLSLGQEDPLEKKMATHSSNYCLENPMDRGAW